jgi:DNA-binding transcriptional ArsR family regulator
MLSEAGELPVSVLKEPFAMSASAVSQHLKVLKEAGVVDVRVHAQQRLYSLNLQGLEAIEAWVEYIRERFLHGTTALEASLILAANRVN